MSAYVPSEAEVEAAATIVEQHPFVTLVVRDGEWVATCDGCDEVLEGGSDMDIACRSHALHLARAALVAAHTVAPTETRLSDAVYNRVAPTPREDVVERVEVVEALQRLADEALRSAANGDAVMEDVGIVRAALATPTPPADMVPAAALRALADSGDRMHGTVTTDHLRALLPTAARTAPTTEGDPT